MDSVGSIETGFSTTISYLWFDTMHTAPLLRIDSTNGITGTNNAVMYLGAPTGVKAVSTDQVSYQAYLDNNRLLVSGNFKYGGQYRVILYNIIGVKVLDEQFMANDRLHAFNINNQVRPGMYFVAIAEKNGDQPANIIKVVKQ